MRRCQPLNFILLVAIGAVFSFTGQIQVQAQKIVINEVVTSNQLGIHDEDGSTPDWIELYNADTCNLNLEGFGLSDDPSNPFKWRFPSVSMPPSGFLLVFASGKDRKPNILYWQTIIRQGDSWKYLVPDSEPSAEWRSIEFNDSIWNSGKSGFGYGDNDDSTVLQGAMSVYIRKSFFIDDTTAIDSAILHMDYDDAFVAYLNGEEIARSGIGTIGIPPPFNQLADNCNHEATIYRGGSPEMFQFSSIHRLLRNGKNTLAIQIHNCSLSSTDLSAIPFLTLGYKSRPSSYTGFPSVLNFSPPRLHSNFKIASSGETLILVAPNGRQLDTISTGFLPPNISIGRKPDGDKCWYLFSEPTPEASNNQKAYSLTSNTEVNFSHAGGFYVSGFSLSLSGKSSDSIYYTLDGSVSTLSSALYKDPIALSNTTVVRAQIIGTGKLPGRVFTQSYIFNNDRHLPVFSISTNPANLWDNDSGIYVLGPNAQSDPPYLGANFWQDWERPVHIELYERDGFKAIDQDAGIKIYGAWTRDFPQKSIALYARGEYGTKYFNYKLFNDKPITEFKSFVLRNSGNDWNITMFRDPLMTGLLKKMDIDRLSNRQAIVFINSQYWGIHTLQEKISKDYLASNHKVDPLQVDLLEFNASPIEGEADHYQAMISFLQSNSPNNQANYEFIKTQMEVDNFIQYTCSQIYFDNTDWPGNNIKYWRPHVTGGKWRWIIYDTDFGFGLYTHAGYANNYSFNTLAFALEPNGPDWPNPPWSTFLLRRLLESQEFKNRFINTFADHLNTTFQYSNVNQQINLVQAEIKDEMPAHILRWANWMTIDQWNFNVQVLRDFAYNRVSYMRDFIQQQFGITSRVKVNLNTSGPDEGLIRLNSILLDTFPWSGIYYSNIPIQLAAIPANGYHFQKWEGISQDQNKAEIKINPDMAGSIKAVFEPNPLQTPAIVINEINYNSASDFNTEDWIELYNPGDIPVDMTNWIFKDDEDQHRFVFPATTILNPGDYLVVCRNSAAFIKLHPDIQNVIGDFGFGLSSSGDCTRLYTADSILVDSVAYGTLEPWPTTVNGTGLTLELVNPGSDNNWPRNWKASVMHGTPGMQNSTFQITRANKVEGNNAILFQNYPNPFSDRTVITFHLNSPARIRLAVYDIEGRMIRIIAEGMMDQGVHEFEWDGKDGRGNNPGPGIFIYRLESRSFALVKRAAFMSKPVQ